MITKMRDYSPEFILERILVLRYEIREDAEVGGYKNEMTGFLNAFDGLPLYHKLRAYESIRILQEHGYFENNFQFCKEQLKENLSQLGTVYDGPEYGRVK